MSKTIRDILKEAFKDSITDETLKQIDEAFNTAVEQKTEERVALAVEAAQDADDEENIKLFQEAVSKIDKTHAKQMTELLQKQAEIHDIRVSKIKSSYTKQMNEDAKKFKDNLLETIALFIEQEIDKHIPEQLIREAADNIQSKELVKKLREVLAIDQAMSDKIVKGTIAEAKEVMKAKTEEANKLITEKNVEAQKIAQELEQTKKEKEETEKRLVLEQYTQKFDGRKKTFILEQFKDKNLSYIKENVPFVSRQYDAFVQERREKILNEAKTKSVTRKLDTPEEILNESKRERVIRVEPTKKIAESDVDIFVNYMKEKDRLGL